MNVYLYFLSNVRIPNLAGVEDSRPDLYLPLLYPRRIHDHAHCQRHHLRVDGR